MSNNSNLQRSHKKKISTGKKVFIWILSILLVLVIAGCGLFAYTYHNVHQAFDKTYKKAKGTTQPKPNDKKYNMVVKLHGIKKDGSDDRLLYVTGTKGKRDFKVKKLQDGTFTEDKNGNVIDKQTNKTLGNTHSSEGDRISKSLNNDHPVTNKDSSNNQNVLSDKDTTNQDITAAKKQTNQKVNYYTSVDMQAAASAVDALGGLDVDGQHMNGNQVVQYYENGHGGAVMSAAMNRKNDIKALFNNGFLNKFAGGTHTNMTWEQAKAAIK